VKLPLSLFFRPDGSFLDLMIFNPAFVLLFVLEIEHPRGERGLIKTACSGGSKLRFHTSQPIEVSYFTGSGREAAAPSALVRNL
jgi:hypothetical protein